MLTARLGDGVSGGAGKATLAREVASAIQPGAAVDAIAHRLLVWAWEAAPQRLSGMMRSAEFLSAGGDVVGLHRRAADGGDVSRGEWRTVRTRLGRLGQGRDDQALAATVMAACAWDYGAAPGAAVDMFGAWEGLVSEILRRADRWGQAEDERYQRLLLDYRALALERVGPEPAGSDPEAARAHSKRVSDAWGGILDASGDPMLGRKAALNARIGEARAALRDQAAMALLALVRTSARRL